MTICLPLPDRDCDRIFGRTGPYDNPVCLFGPVLLKINAVGASNRFATRSRLHFQIFDRVGTPGQKQHRTQRKRETGIYAIHISAPNKAFLSRASGDCNSFGSLSVRNRDALMVAENGYQPVYQFIQLPTEALTAPQQQVCIPAHAQGA
ncbi:MAG TPA: hypothetical protein VFW28_08230 [Micropepsaceae bacterium]|nr:hypothetical protein [Micropepsaceae bacterium]